MTNKALLEQMREGCPYLNFSLEKTVWIAELSCPMNWLRHTGGAQVIYFDRKDEERCFSFSFPAFPEDDTGVYHVIEHSILGPSEKYPVKNWMQKGPQSSFLSAFTCMDNTMYVAASRFEKSFQDLIKIYADSVFRPGFLKTEYPFLQEGFHFLYDENSDTITGSGIVYNEVLAAHALPDYRATQMRFAAAFPESSYAHDIGGAPGAVPSLTYQHFLDTYRRVFRPENVLATVWGDTNLSAVLNTLSPYFETDFPAEKQITHFPVPARWTGDVLAGEYPVLMKKDGQDYVGLSWAFSYSRRDLLLARVAGHLLHRSLSERLVTEALCDELRITCETESAYPLLSFLCIGTDARKRERLRQVVAEGIVAFNSAGIRPEELKAAVHAVEFDLCRGVGGLPKGIDTAVQITSAFVHHQELSDPLRYRDILEEVQAGDGQEIIEFLRRTVLNNEYYSEFQLVSSEQQAARQKAERQAFFTELRRNSTQESLREMCRRQIELEKWQADTETEEKLQLLPHTCVSDYPETLPEKGIEILQTDGGPILYLETQEGLMRMTLHFPIERFDLQYLHTLGILALLFGRTAAGCYTVRDIALISETYTDGMQAGPHWYRTEEGDRLYFEVTLLFLAKDFENIQSLLWELLQTGIYTDPENMKKLLREYLRNVKTRLPDPVSRVRAHYSQGAAAAEHINGLAFQSFLQNLLIDFASQADALCASTARAAEELLRGPVTIGFSGDVHGIRQIQEKIRLHSELKKPAICQVPLFSGNEIFPCSAHVNYLAQGARLERIQGATWAARCLLERYLTEQIRENGGAYTVRALLYPEGDMVLSTSRDPHFQRTLDVFSRAVHSIQNVTEQDAAFAVISGATYFLNGGTAQISGFRSRSFYEIAAGYYFCEWDQNVRQRFWSELIHATPEQIQEAIRQFLSVCEKGVCCAYRADE